MSFQLALPTECIRQIFRFSNCFNSFNSHSLRSVSSTSAVYNSIYHLSTRARYGAYLGKQHEYIREVHLSTRTLYGVYPAWTYWRLWDLYFNSHPLRSVSCIGLYILSKINISTRTLYGVYHYVGRELRFFIEFQLAPSTECISKMA